MNNESDNRVKRSEVNSTSGIQSGALSHFAELAKLAKGPKGNRRPRIWYSVQNAPIPNMAEQMKGCM